MTDQNIFVGKTSSGSEWWWYADRHNLTDLYTMTERIKHFGGTPSEAALALVSNITVTLNPSRIEIVDYFAPVEGDALTVLATRVKGSSVQLSDLADRICPNEWADAVLSRFNGELSEGFRNAQYAASVKAAKATARALRAVTESKIRR